MARVGPLLKRLGWIIVSLIVPPLLLSVMITLLILSSAKPPAVPSHATLVIPIGGQMREAPADGLSLMNDEPSFSIEEITRQLHHASKDDRIYRILLVFGNSDLSFGRAAEIREAVSAFRESGKRVIAYLDSATTMDYLVATAAEKIYAAPQADVALTGLAADVQFFKGLLDKAGIEADFEHTGDYKTAMDQFSRDSISPAHQEMLSGLLDDLFKAMVDRISSSRQMNIDTVHKAIDDGLLTVTEAKTYGLIDDLLYRDQLEELLKTEDHESPFHLYEAKHYLRHVENQRESGSPRIGLIVLEGAVQMEDGGVDNSSITPGKVHDLLKAAQDDTAVKAIVLRINSPGGSALAADLIWRDIQKTREKIPVVASMSDVAASGGYYIAMGCDAIVAHPETVTGSIGVIAGKFSVEGLLKKLAIEHELMTRGRHAAIFSPSRRFTESERKRLRNYITSFYENFLSKAADGRHLKIEQIRPVAEGRVWSGARAHSIGLVDALGGLKQALAMAQEKAGIAKESSVSVKLFKPKTTLFETMVHSVLSIRGGSLWHSDILAKTPLSNQLLLRSIIADPDNPARLLAVPTQIWQIH